MDEIFSEVFAVIEGRKKNPRQESYVSGLMREGLSAMLRKVEEESTELVLAAKDGDTEGMIHEATDLLFHTFVLLAYQGIGLKDIRGELRRRRRS